MSHKIPSYYRYVESITITNAGSGYDSSNPPTITLSGGGGTNATATCTILGGEINTVTVTNPGTGYTSAPTITISGSGGAVLTAVLSFAAGDTTEHTHSNIDNVKYSIPDFIRSDYTTFVTFIEKYYEWMEQENNPINILLNNHFYDIDEANDEELDRWRQMLAKQWPKNVPVDRRFLYKRIKDIYESKGSKSSIESFFRLFYGEDVDILYPSKFILRASDGIWTERQSVKVTTANDYEVLNLTGSLIDIYYYISVGSVYRQVKIPATVTDVIKIDATSPQQWEVFLKFDNQRTTLPGPGAGGEGTIVFEGPIATVDTVGAADASRAAGTYTIGASDWTSDGAGSAAEFTVVVDGTGDATVTIDVDGEGFVIDETITIADANLGAGGGAALTFDVATLVEGELKVNDITLTSTGGGYLAAPTIVINDETGSSAAARLILNTTSNILKDVIVTNKGSGYTSTTTTVNFQNIGIDTFITMRDSSTPRAYLVRGLNSVSAGTYIGSGTPNFKVGDLFLINESGDDDRGYALDYFAEDYVLIGGRNNAYAKVSTVSGGIPQTWTILTSGYSFNVASSTISLTDDFGESVNVTISTGYLFSYEGEYKDDRGKLSDVNRLQDNRKYQVYSYIIKSTNPQSEWNQNLRDTVHPAGWEVFGELTIQNEVSFEDFTIDVPKLHIYYFEDDVFSNEGGETSEAIAIEYEMVRADSATASEANTKLIAPAYSDAVTLDDSGSSNYFAEDYMLLPDTYVSEGGFIKLVRPVQSDVSSVTDLLVPEVAWNRAFSDSAIISEVAVTQLNILRSFSDSVTLSDSFNFSWNIEPSDAVTVSETSVVFDTSLNKSDVATTSQTLVINTSSGISDTGTASEVAAKNFTTSRSDSATTSDSGSINGPQDYADGTYFAEDYVIGTSLGSF